jgi:biopolymer transport protein ExbD
VNFSAAGLRPPRVGNREPAFPGLYPKRQPRRGAKMHSLRTQQPQPDINAAPITDLAFQVAIFLMVCALFSAPRGLDFNLDQDCIGLARPMTPVLVEFLPSGQVSVDGVTMEEPVFLSQLPALLEADPSTLFIFSPLPSTSFAKIITILEVWRAIDAHGARVPQVAFASMAHSSWAVTDAS